ncbi:exodeoxyribonuclease VII small subunit [bacterium]|nr:exodeoxyribonuclease VII small subunit [bacterium]
MAKETKERELEELLSAKDPKALIEGMKFENGMRLLQELVSQVEGGGMELERSIVSYERGMIVLEYLRGVLSQAEEKLEIVPPTESTSS